MSKCYFCDREVTEDDFCLGCENYICNLCDENEVAGDHTVEDHKD
jgi:hypothetical protein